MELFCKALMHVSPTIVACAILWRILRLFISRKWLCEHRVPDMWAMFGYSALLLTAMWCLRLAESYVQVTEAGMTTTAALTVWEGWGLFCERLMKTIVQTLKAFGVEENIGDHIEKGKYLASLLWSQWSWFPLAYGIYAAALNLLAPITGAALIFEVIASIFPKVQVWFLQWNIFRKKYIFSQLNPQSLALATSIIENKGSWYYPAPVIVFTNADLQSEDETQNTLLQKAKRLGAICTPDDICTISKRRFWPRNGREYMLMDPVDVNNVIKYAEMAELPDCETEKWLYQRLKGCGFWIFCQDNAYVLTETEITERINNVFRQRVSHIYKGKGGRIYKGWWRPRFWLWKHKLYLIKIEEANQDKIKAVADNKKLNKLQRSLRRWALLVKADQPIKVTQEEVVTALINLLTPTVRHTRPYMNIVNSILEQHPLFMPLTQQAQKNTLNIAILGGGGIGTEMLLGSYWCGQLLDVKLGINMVSLEEAADFRNRLDAISEEILQSSVSNHPLLQIYDGEKATNDPYCTFRYHSANLLVTAPETITCAPMQLDEKGNMMTGAEPMDLLDADYFLVALGSDEANITVAERLCRALALHTEDSGQKVVVCVVYDSALHRSMNQGNHPYGSKLQRYAVGGIEQMYSYDNIILKANQEQAKEQDKRYRRMAGLMPEGKDTLVKKPYDYWSSDANAKHRIYKSFCAFRRYTHGKIASWDQWKQTVGINWCYRDDTVRKDMEWLEHRRWNAYIRSIGFVYGKNTNKKLRVHSCLVESARIPIPGKQDRLDNDVKKYDVPEIISDANQEQVHAYVESLPTAEPEPAGV